MHRPYPSTHDSTAQSAVRPRDTSLQADMAEGLLQVVADYDLREHTLDDHEAHATPGTRFERRPRQGLPSARTLQRTGKGTSESQRACRNCGEMGRCASRRCCPKPRARCTHPICVVRAVTDHCGAACFIRHPEIVPQHLRSMCEKVEQQYHQRRGDQSAHYVDEDGWLWTTT